MQNGHHAIHTFKLHYIQFKLMYKIIMWSQESLCLLIYIDGPITSLTLNQYYYTMLESKGTILAETGTVVFIDWRAITFLGEFKGTIVTLYMDFTGNWLTRTHMNVIIGIIHFFVLRRPKNAFNLEDWLNLVAHSWKRYSNQMQTLTTYLLLHKPVVEPLNAKYSALL